MPSSSPAARQNKLECSTPTLLCRILYISSWPRLQILDKLEKFRHKRSSLFSHTHCDYNIYLLQWHLGEAERMLWQSAKRQIAKWHLAKFSMCAPLVSMMLENVFSFTSIIICLWCLSIVCQLSYAYLTLWQY